MSGMKALLDRLCEAVESEAREAGKRNAGWYVPAQHATHEQLRALLAGIRDGDPLVMDALPYWDWHAEETDPSADGYTWERVWSIAVDAAALDGVDIGEYDPESFLLESLVSAFEAGWSEGAEHEIESSVIYRLEDCDEDCCTAVAA